jgi:hypothetical protein
VDKDSAWNQWLRHEVARLFVQAFDDFKVRVTVLLFTNVCFNPTNRCRSYWRNVRNFHIRNFELYNFNTCIVESRLFPWCVIDCSAAAVYTFGR